MTGNLWILLAAGGAVVAVFVALSLLADNYGPMGHGAGDPQQLRAGAIPCGRLAGGQEFAGSARLGAGQPRRKKRRHHGAGGQR